MQNGKAFSWVVESMNSREFTVVLTKRVITDEFETFAKRTSLYI